ncbi:MAG: D-alanine--D-alanine ligase [Candidatus Tenebribacter burtonii]|nr:D-alanine--D-alanine ligase [Candidatus Tenebribacter burtonii]
MNNLNKIIILSGGFSYEAEVSKTTAKEIEKALNNNVREIILIDPVKFDSYSEMIIMIKEIKPDIVFNGLHGAEGEDGKIQSLLALENIAFTGSTQLASAISMDKYISGILAGYIKIKLPKRRLIYKDYKYDFKSIVEYVGFPMVIKPNDSGSSVGITIINKENELEESLKHAFKFSEKAIIEQFIAGRELTVTILGNEALPVVEILPNEGWYDYKNKYTKGKTTYEVPAELTSEEVKIIQKQALDVFHLFGCEIYGRVDFRYDGKDFYFLEVNTLPGMTQLSLTPMAAREAGISFKELLYKIIELSVNRK